MSKSIIIASVQRSGDLKITQKVATPPPGRKGNMRYIASSFCSETTSWFNASIQINHKKYSESYWRYFDTRFKALRIVLNWFYKSCPSPISRYITDHNPFMMLRNNVKSFVEGSLYFYLRIQVVIVDFRYDVYVMISWLFGCPQQLSIKITFIV